MDSPYDIINTDDTLWFLFIVNDSCLGNDPHVAAVSCQEAVAVCFSLTFADYWWKITVKKDKKKLFNYFPLNKNGLN